MAFVKQDQWRPRVKKANLSSPLRIRIDRGPVFSYDIFVGSIGIIGKALRKAMPTGIRFFGGREKTARCGAGEFRPQTETSQKGGGEMTGSIRIADTTREERERIVAESIGNISGLCDGCSPGIAEMYLDYIDGRKELREINAEFRARYMSGDSRPERGGCAGGE